MKAISIKAQKGKFVECNLKSFETTVPGKWILSGEHTVLRGGEALVFPLKSKSLNLKYTYSNEELELNIEGVNKSDLELIVWSVIERACKLLNIKRSTLQGHLFMNSNIALGGGMGASATLCAALTEWFSELGLVAFDRQFDFARDLENLFHGESSGVDVAVTLKKEPLVFTRNNGFSYLDVKKMPLLYLSYSGQRGVTKDCVSAVKELIQTNSEFGISIDEQMKETVFEFKKLLKADEVNLIDWIKTVKKANNCFEKWGLITEQVKIHQNQLLQNGALAVKLTGSGGGGYVLSLWDSHPSKLIPFEMISCQT
jgi:mevalonate kinase